MARGDLVCRLIQYGLSGDSANFRKASEAILAEEKNKRLDIIADKIVYLLKKFSEGPKTMMTLLPKRTDLEFVQEIAPQRQLEALFLSDVVKEQCHELIEDQRKTELLQSYGVEPRSKILMVGPPGNGKTSLAEAIASALELPLYVVRYESIISSLLGETATKLGKLFEFAQAQPCVLFFDEFETVGKERADQHETGEMRRIVGSLLLQMDALPSHVIAIAATNHEGMLDHAAWRRFQMKLELNKPDVQRIEQYLAEFEMCKNIEFGAERAGLAEKLQGQSYAEIENFALSVYRQYILRLPCGDVSTITNAQLARCAILASGKLCRKAPEDAAL